MQISRGWRLIIYLIGLTSFVLFAAVVINPKLLNDSQFYSRGILGMFCSMVVAGLFIWFWEGRKYYKIATAIVQVVASGFIAVHEWIRHRDWSNLGLDLCLLLCIVGLIQLKMAIKDQISQSRSEETIHPSTGK
jgi:hypothetical protein